MVLNEAKDIRLGTMPVSRVYLGDELVWSSDEKHLSVSPMTIWLTEENDYTDFVEVISNTNWKIKEED